MDRLVEWINSRNLLKVAFGIFVVSGILVGASFVLGIDKVIDPETGRDVGYAQATNWIGTFMILFPMMTLGIAWLVAVLARVVPELQQKMLRPQTDAADWRAHLRAGVPWLLVFAVLAVGSSVYECWADAYRSLFATGTTERHSWATAALLEEETVSPGLNFAFVAVAWSVQAAAKLVALVFFWQVLTLAVWLGKYGLGFGKARLAAELDDPDERCGFQRFEMTGALLFGIVTLSLIMMWLPVAYNVSRSAKAPGTWVYAFHYGDNPIAGLFATGTMEYDVFWSRAIGLMMLLVGLVLVVGVMMPAVIQATRAWQLEGLPESKHAKLHAMPGWPFRFVGAVEFGCLVALTAVSLWFFRLAPWVLFVTVGVIFLRAQRRLKKAGATQTYAYVMMAALLIGGGVLVGKAWHTNAAYRGEDWANPIGYEPDTDYSAEYAASHALLIGIDYEGANRLRNAQRDATTLKQVLEGMASEWKVTLLLGSAATESAIHDALRKLRNTTKKDDRVLIFFAGHGKSTGEREGYLVPYGGKDEASWIDFDEVRKKLDALPAKHVLLAMDCCYSGKATRALGGEDLDAASLQRLKEKHLMKRARVVIASAGRNETAEDGPENGHSPFASALFEALRSDTKVLDAHGLFTSITTSFAKNEIAQTPQLDFIDQSGYFLFFPKQD